ncbi:MULTISPECIES: hypothetical protein [Rheinheimera]|jgi:hypothetical protein|uniref:Uncharacterized protein n=1 Tax=Rheinheimera tangshanensis TaxID=400153 RepID=A0A5C8M6S3_9GAMM|nr:MULTISPECIES: hypothetical protein [Rheinheimera]KOO58940.1 hypothetical protein WH43_06965 [Rheinheimera sp. KL1]TXK83080.1 hypothetical protein FU839_02045 [Rheinheimera tangshanensis]GGM46446.1 hypothetical protein GCM10010920_03540 [Rheinheimera tangshanensis]
MKTLATLVLVTTAAFAVTPAAQANELSLPSVNTQAVSVLAAELMSQQMAELKVAILEQSQKALAELATTLATTTETEKETVIAVAKVD